MEMKGKVVTQAEYSLGPMVTAQSLCYCMVPSGNYPGDLLVLLL